MSENGRMDIKNKIWDICGILRDDGMHIGSYVEQVTILLFLKMLEEREDKFEGTENIPEEYNWESLKEKNGKELLQHYEDTLRELGQTEGLLGEIFGRVNSQFRTPVNLRKAIKEIDNINWDKYDADVKGAAYESLLERYAEEAKGAGQYFTPRPAIEATVEAVDPEYDETIHDPAAGTGGFLIHAYEHILDKNNDGAALNREEREALMEDNISGVELVPETRRLGLMNMVLHDLYGDIERANSLESPPNEKFDVILANPPYGGQNQQEPPRDDFFVETKKPELNFLQHAFTRLKDGGRCGIVVPDGVLFQTGQARDVRKQLLRNCNVHTILILPIGAFHPYTNVTTNIVFFEKGEKTEEVDFYDLRTDVEKIKKSNPLTEEHFQDFLDNFDSREVSDKYFSVSIEEIKENDWSLNYKKYKEFDNGDEELPAPEELLTELLSLQETITQNTQQILDEIEAEN
ncbi:MAG: N-6 DNA methylase [Candidatus Nanohaloarchaea archaeon]